MIDLRDQPLTLPIPQRTVLSTCSAPLDARRVAVLTSWVSAVLTALVCLALRPEAAEAVTLKVASTGGLMQQPTSQYYHAVYGGYVEIASASQRLIGRGQYVERPEFSNVGYVDKDYGAFAQVGAKLTAAKTHGLLAFVGYGRMSGYIRAESATRAQTDVSERHYAIPGPIAAVEYAVRLGRIDLAVNHQTFVGFADRTQTDAYVAWPFNFFQVSAGVLW